MPNDLSSSSPPLPDPANPQPARRTPARRPHGTALLWVVTIGAWLPLLVLAFDAFTGRLTVNPIQAAEQRTGDIAITLLVLSLACTPLNTLLRWPAVLKVRRSLGLYAYLYAFLHVLLFIGLDYGFNTLLLLQALLEKPFILVGLAGFILLSALALTSFDTWKGRLGKNWKRLHRLTYLINLLVVLHFGWAVKGDFLRLQGDVLRPLLAGLAVLLLLGLRLPAVRRRLAGRLHALLPSRKAPPEQ